MSAVWGTGRERTQVSVLQGGRKAGEGGGEETRAWEQLTVLSAGWDRKVKDEKRLGFRVAAHSLGAYDGNFRNAVGNAVGGDADAESGIDRGDGVLSSTFDFVALERLQ